MSSTQPTQTHTLVIHPGQTAVLKAGARLISVVKSGNISATSNCETLQDAIDNADSMACFRILWVAEGNKNNDTGPFSWTNGDMKIAGFGIGTSFFDMNNFTFNVFGSQQERCQAFNARLAAAMGPNAIVKGIWMHKSGGVGERDEFTFRFEAPASLGSTAYLKITSPAGGDPSLVVALFYAERCDGCCSEGC